MRAPAIARSTATRCAPRSRSRSRTRTSPSPSFRSPAPARPSPPASSARSASPNARTRAPTPPARRSSRAQIAALTEALAIARKHRADRKLDLVLLTIGANDIQFSGLVADVIIEVAHRAAAVRPRRPHRHVADSQRDPRPQPARTISLKLRAALKPLVGGNLVARRVRVLRPSGAGRARHALPRRPRRLRRASGLRRRSAAAAAAWSDFVSNEFLPKIKALALCDGKLCRDPRNRPDDLRRRASGGVRAARRLRALRQRSGIRPRLFLRRRRELPHRSRARRPPIRWPAAGRPANTAPMRRARAGCAPPTTAISPP